MISDDPANLKLKYVYMKPSKTLNELYTQYKMNDDAHKKLTDLLAERPATDS